MSEQPIIGVSVGTPISPEKMNDELKPVKTVNGKVPDENGNVKVVDENYVTPQMFGAKGDGVTDDTAAIQAALNASSYVYIPDGTYMVMTEFVKEGGSWTKNGTLHPRSNQTIILSENAVLKSITNNSTHYYMFHILSVENVHIMGGKLLGERNEHETEPEGEWGYGIAVDNSKYITIENMEICGFRGDAICTGYGNVNTPTKHVKILNCKLHDNRRQGISITGGEDITIRDCEIFNIKGVAPQYGIDIEPDGDYRKAINITIDNCYIHDNGVGAICVAATTNEIRNINIINCTLSDINFQGVLDGETIKGGKECYVSNCNVGRVYFYVPSPVRVSNSKLHCITLGGGTAIINDCDIVNDGNLVGSTNDRIETQKSNLYCHNCRFVANDVTSLTYALLTGSGNSTYGLPDEIFVFKNCSFELGNYNHLTARAAGKEMVFDGCNITYKWTPPSYLGLISVTQGGSGATNRIVLHNTKVECAETVNAVIGVDGNKIAYFDISNCSFSATTYLMNVASGSTCELKLFKSDISSTTLNGSGTKTANIINSFLTSIPSEYVTETELKNKGYLTQHQDISGKADKSTAETWTFTLEDGSIITKKVVLA